MFIRVTHIEVKSGQWNAFLKDFETSTIPQLEAESGFLRIICSGDEASGEVNLITMWQKSEQGGGAGHEALDPALDKLQDYLVTTPVSSGYDEILERTF